MPDTLAISIFNHIRDSHDGCGVDELVQFLPSRFTGTDVGPEPLLGPPLQTLLDLGLIEAYRRRHLVSARKFKKLLRKGFTFTLVDALRELQFFLSPSAAHTEATLGVSLVGRSHRVFVDPDNSTIYPNIFILMPFRRGFAGASLECIFKVAERLYLSAGRADDIFSTGSVMQSVWSAINHATVVIADCTERNANVFYEIGLAHALDKETVLLSQSVDDIPFDLRHLRVIIYDPCNPQSMDEFEHDLWYILRRLCRREERTM